MAMIQIFCTLDEMAGWLRALCVHFELASLTFRASEQHGVLLHDCSMFNISSDTNSIFLFPQNAAPTTALKMNDVKARPWGWAYIRPGQLIPSKQQTILLLSDIHGEDFDVEPVHPAKYVHWLRRRIKKEAYIGVKIKSEDDSGERVVRDIRYSQQALALYHSGVVWKQFVDGKAFFTPVDDLDETRS